MIDALILGAGPVGGRVAAAWRDEGRSVAVLTRSERRAEELAGQGYLPIVGDVTRPETLAELPAAERVVWAIGLDRAAGDSPEAVYVRGLAAVLGRFAAMGHVPRVWVQVSTTGVTGDAEGATVDETTVCRPTRESGIANLAAERLLQASAVGPHAVILRLAGLYGPGRVPTGPKLDGGSPLPVPEGSVLNLVHLDDAAAAVRLAAERATPPALYVVSDGSPVARRTWYRAVAAARGLPEPTFVDEAAGDADADRPRGRESKRIDPAKIGRELGFRPAYPSYREGLAAIFGR